jgi:hypothetical protein
MIVTIASNPLESIIPIINIVMISLTLADRDIIRIITAPAPIHEAAMRIQFPRPLRLSTDMLEWNPRIIIATPRLAPELIPRTSGPAIGFLNTVCINNPLRERAIPTVRAVTAFGILNSKIMVLFAPDGFSKRALKTSEALMLTDPKKISRIRNKISEKNRSKKISFCFLLIEGDPSASLLSKDFMQQVINGFFCKSTVHFQGKVQDVE